MKGTLGGRYGVGKILHLLQEKHGWLASDAHVFFLAGNWQDDVRRWVTRHQQRRKHGGRPAPPQTQSARDWAKMNDGFTSKRQFLEMTVSAPQGSSTPMNAFYVFDDANPRMPLLQREDDHGDVVTFPFTTTEAASYIRHDKQKIWTGNSTDLSTCMGSSVNVLSGEYLRSHTLLRDLRSAFLPRQAADLLAVDFVGETSSMGTSPERFFTDLHTRDSLVNVMALGTHLLRPSGALLLRFPFSVRPQDKPVISAVRQHMRWCFQVAACEVDNDHLYCMGYRHATWHPITPEPKSPFPGFFQKSMRRPKKWNPRRKRDRNYFVALKPGFTDAPLVKEPLGRAIEEEVRATKKVEEKADALFGVSLGMVERRAHQSKRDD
ncbi:hypothetical protein C3747_276g32 [Trypanosoma cruzi]|uniref:Uncharacterized protein n=1 Tax=Trypanosoma cruzi TaxID=5693 RepID=A0A2V2VGN5_TRYCR|nr:hypothetical protein TcYC6_0117230 [Trypanosoma cruzi]PWU94592.1 hypothetical protein C3747_276g32 [Trypanosoma cruzi]RNC58443.1 hypothetical protein TcCL_ESM03907 [Trypanosoma cruzi]